MTGLKQRIENAVSKTEVEDLMRQGENYQFASATTKRRWSRVAQKRIVFLGTLKKTK